MLHVEEELNAGGRVAQEISLVLQPEKDQFLSFILSLFFGVNKEAGMLVSSEMAQILF